MFLGVEKTHLGLIRYLLLLLGIVSSLLLMNCKRKTYICPAYQSAFYLDQKKAKGYFTFTGRTDSLRADTTLKIKNQYLVAKYVPLQKKYKQISIIPMETVFIPQSKEDSLRKAAELMLDSLNQPILDKKGKPLLKKDQPVPPPTPPKDEDDEDADDKEEEDNSEGNPSIPTPSPAPPADSTKRK